MLDAMACFGLGLPLSERGFSTKWWQNTVEIAKEKQQQ
jgi:hypothetical protein